VFGTYAPQSWFATQCTLCRFTATPNVLSTIENTRMAHCRPQLLKRWVNRNSFCLLFFDCLQVVGAQLACDIRRDTTYVMVLKMMTQEHSVLSETLCALKVHHFLDIQMIATPKYHPW
jgi:hypothetical protein